MFATATAWLERHVGSLNAINVFPVPDGDTGTNMYLTMRSTLEEARRNASHRAGAILKAMARGALMGARGNSGVILSQIIRGWAKAVEGLERLDGRALARALAEGAATAYKSVSQPVEGTILTVVREAAEAARRKAARRGQSFLAVLHSAAEAAKAAVAKTPSLLPILAEAGVVDAGGQGLYIVLEGAMRYLQGAMEAEGPPPAEVEQKWLAATEAMHQQGQLLYGYCTEYLLEGIGLDVEAIRGRMEELGDSVLVVGDDRLVRVHVHTKDPGAAISYGTALGSLTQVKVDNMEVQYRAWAAQHRAQVAEAPNIGVVAVAFGRGLASIFNSLGAAAVVEVAPNVKPSTQELLAAVEGCPSQRVIILPNDSNVIMAAEEAARLSPKQVRVVRALTTPQGVAALLALNQEQDLEANLKAMEEAMAAVRTAEVAPAVRSTVIGGVQVRQGQVIALVDGRLVAAAETPREAVLGALKEMGVEGASLITLYWGAGVGDEEAKALAQELRSIYPHLEVEVAYGGQPHHFYILSVE